MTSRDIFIEKQATMHSKHRWTPSEQDYMAIMMPEIQRTFYMVLRILNSEVVVLGNESWEIGAGSWSYGAVDYHLYETVVSAEVTAPLCFALYIHIAYSLKREKR